MAKKIPSLFTPKDVQETRKQFLTKQKNKDPILQELIEAQDAVLDHDHISQHCRGALHRQSNAFEGLVFNAYRRCLQWLTDKPLPDILRNLATYLEQDCTSNPYHTGWIKKVQTEFNKLTASQQQAVLKELQSANGNNAQARKLLFKKRVISKEYGYDDIMKVINSVKD